MRVSLVDAQGWSQVAMNGTKDPQTAEKRECVIYLRGKSSKETNEGEMQGQS
jgi:hypothetical protein